MGAEITAVPSLYAAKTVSNDQGDTDHIDGVNMNDLQSQCQIIVKYMSRAQSISVDSSGTTTFTPTNTWLGPTGVFFSAKDSTASTMLSASQHVTNCTTSGITVKHGTGAADGSAYATVVYLS